MSVEISDIAIVGIVVAGAGVGYLQIFVSRQSPTPVFEVCQIVGLAFGLIFGTLGFALCSGGGVLDACVSGDGCRSGAKHNKATAHTDTHAILSPGSHSVHFLKDMKRDMHEHKESDSKKHQYADAA